MLSDLRELVGNDGPWFTIAIPTPRHLDDARHRFEVEWKNARAALSDTWASDDLADVDRTVAELPHTGGEALVVVHAAGRSLIEFLPEPIVGSMTAEGTLPRLALVIEARQRVVPHVVVETDRAGADVHAFDRGNLVGAGHVDSETLHIHRGHPGGWSQRRFRHRAENTWERNADDVAGAVADTDGRVGAEMVFIAGDVRAQTLVLEALPERVRAHAVRIEAGSPDGIAAEVGVHLADHVARRTRDLAEQVKNRLGSGTASTDTAEVTEALSAGRVEHLLVHDDGRDEPMTDGTRLIDTAIVAALRSDADITVVPGLAILDGPLGALLRW